MKEVPYKAKDPVQYVDQNQVDYFEKMTNFTSVAGENVTYPYSKDSSESGYEWYTANHAKYDRIKKKIANMPNMQHRDDLQRIYGADESLCAAC